MQQPTVLRVQINKDIQGTGRSMNFFLGYGAHPLLDGCPGLAEIFTFLCLADIPEYFFVGRRADWVITVVLSLAEGSAIVLLLENRFIGFPGLVALEYFLVFGVFDLQGFPSDLDVFPGRTGLFMLDERRGDMAGEAGVIGSQIAVGFDLSFAGLLAVQILQFSRKGAMIGQYLVELLKVFCVFLGEDTQGQSQPISNSVLFPQTVDRCFRFCCLLALKHAQPHETQSSIIIMLIPDSV